MRQNVLAEWHFEWNEKFFSESSKIKMVDLMAFCHWKEKGKARWLFRIGNTGLHEISTEIAYYTFDYPNRMPVNEIIPIAEKF